jgi:hypothetical protein
MIFTPLPSVPLRSDRPTNCRCAFTGELDPRKAAGLTMTVSAHRPDPIICHSLCCSGLCSASLRFALSTMVIAAEIFRTSSQNRQNEHAK